MIATCRPRRRAALALAPLLLLGLGIGALPAHGSVPGPMTHYRVICGPGASKTYGCHTAGDYDSNAQSPSGWTPADLSAQYGLPAEVVAAVAPTPPRVAVVVAYDYPTAAQDLAVYRSTFGLPRCGAKCFVKLDQDGGMNYPAPDAGRAWASTAAATLQMVSAVCPACRLELVEADGSVFVDLEAAVATAARTADVVVAPFGSTESRELSAHGRAVAFRGVPVVVSTGNGGYSVPPQFPATSSRVTAVGGTRLVHRGARLLELANPQTVSGCSRYFAKPAFQHDRKCAMRTVADVAAVSEGVAVYDSYLPQTPGWGIVDGTGVAAGIIGGMYGLAGNAATISDARNIYAHPAALHDIVGGANGSCGSYLCTAVSGYDGPTGMGSPNGIGAF